MRGLVRYDEFLRASGYHDAQLPRYSEISTGHAAAAAAAADVAAQLPSVGNTRGKRASSAAGGRAAATGRRSEKVKEEEEDGGLLERARVVLVHLSEVCAVLDKFVLQ